MKVHVYQYTDYVLYLNDWFAEQKENRPVFSHRWFAQKAGFKSKSLMQFVLKGERALNASSLQKVARAIGLGKRETQYFEALVLFRESNDSDRQLHWEKICKLGKTSEAVRLRSREFDFFGHWYIAPLREIVCNSEFSGDFAWLARQLSPRIREKEAREAVELLLELKLIRKKGRGKSLRYEHAALHLSASELVKSMALREFQRQNNKLALEAFERHAREERNISTITLGTSQKGFDEIQNRIAEFHEDVVKIVEAHEGMERVYQLNLQLFPLSRKLGKA